jgi:hypothetical protein
MVSGIASATFVADSTLQALSRSRIRCMCGYALRQSIIISVRFNKRQSRSPNVILRLVFSGSDCLALWQATLILKAP